MSVSQNFPEVRPTLNLNFARSKTLDPRITFTRASTGTYVGSDGLIKTAVADEARFDHDPTTGESLGLLIEESRVNYHRYSTNFANWTPTLVSSTLTPTTDTLDPAGGTGAYVLYGWMERNYEPGPGSGTSFPFRGSVFVKRHPLGRNTFALFLTAAGGDSNITINFDTETVSASGQTPQNPTIEKFPNGWYRIGLTITPGSTRWRPVLGASPTADTYWYVYGVQIETDLFNTSYIPTSGSTVTRNADTVEITGINFTDWYSPNPQTWFINYDTPYVVPNVHTPTLLNLGNIGYIQDIAIRVQGNDKILFWEDSSGSSDTFINSTFTGQNCLDCKYAVAVDLPSGNLTQSVNGLSDYRTFTAEPFKNSTRMFLGNATGSSFKYLNGHISHFIYYPERLTDTQLQNLTK